LTGAVGTGPPRLRESTLPLWAICSAGQGNDIIVGGSGMNLAVWSTAASCVKPTNTVGGLSAPTNILELLGGGGGPGDFTDGLILQS
jgi:hypothetical protein